METVRVSGGVEKLGGVNDWERTLLHWVNTVSVSHCITTHTVSRKTQVCPAQGLTVNTQNISEPNEVYKLDKPD